MRYTLGSGWAYWVVLAALLGAGAARADSPPVVSCTEPSSDGLGGTLVNYEFPGAIEECLRLGEENEPAVRDSRAAAAPNATDPGLGTTVFSDATSTGPRGAAEAQVIFRDTVRGGAVSGSTCITFNTEHGPDGGTIVFPQVPEDASPIFGYLYFQYLSATNCSVDTMPVFANATINGVNINTLPYIEVGCINADACFGAQATHFYRVDVSGLFQECDLNIATFELRGFGQGNSTGSSWVEGATLMVAYCSESSPSMDIILVEHPQVMPEDTSSIVYGLDGFNADGAFASLVLGIGNGQDATETVKFTTPSSGETVLGTSSNDGLFDGDCGGEPNTGGFYDNTVLDISNLINAGDTSAWFQIDATSDCLDSNAAFLTVTSQSIPNEFPNHLPVVSNVIASQRTDGSKLVDIYYNLADADGNLCTVTLLASDDGGATWTVPIAVLTGAVGGGVTPGTGRHIVWDSAADLPDAYGTNYKVRVCAFEGQGPGADMVLIPAGSFDMGDTFNEGENAELPVHAVYLDAYYVDRYEVTKGLWDTVRTWSTSNGYDLIDAPGKAPDHPVHSVNWYDCVKWCNARSEQEGRTPCYYAGATLTAVYKTGEIAPYVNWDANGYRLPTEAEWEKAARGGTPGHRFPWSDTDTIQHARANYYSGPYPYDTSPTSGHHPLWAGRGYPYTSAVGFFTGALQYRVDWGWPGAATSYQTADGANGYALHDMAGNVWEWCNDWYDLGYYDDYPIDGWPPNPTGPASGTYRVLRGGDWNNNPRYCRVADRLHAAWPGDRYSYIGFRCVMESP